MRKTSIAVANNFISFLRNKKDDKKYKCNANETLYGTIMGITAK